MPTLNLLYKQRVSVTEHISIIVPQVSEILDCEDDYYSLVSALTAMPIDYMVQLDDIGIDFTEIDEYELFLLQFSAIQQKDTRLIFGDLDLSRFTPAVSEENGKHFLIDQSSGAIIDYAIHDKIAQWLRMLHHIDKNIRKPANAAAKKYMIERARLRQKRRGRRIEKSYLESLIIAMVNAEQYKYDYAGTLDLTIYQFNESVRQIIHKVDYDNRMHGIYAGTVDVKSLSQDDLNWLKHK